MYQSPHDYQVEIKRKLRKLKKLEVKIRFNNFTSLKNPYISSSYLKNEDLVWDTFFVLRENSNKKATYSIDQLTKMSKEELKDVIIEYFYNVYYVYNKENGITYDHSLLDIETLRQLGLPMYADNDDIKRRFKELAKKYHPDNGGDSSKFIEVMEKYNEVIR